MLFEEDDLRWPRFPWFRHRRLRRDVRDWHRARSSSEPPCTEKQWRTRDRDVVVNIRDMTDHHLSSAIGFAKMRLQHASRTKQLLEEQNRRRPLDGD